MFQVSISKAIFGFFFVEKVIPGILIKGFNVGGAGGDFLKKKKPIFDSGNKLIVKINRKSAKTFSVSVVLSHFTIDVFVVSINIERIVFYMCVYSEINLNLHQIVFLMIRVQMTFFLFFVFLFLFLYSMRNYTHEINNYHVKSQHFVCAYV